MIYATEFQLFAPGDLRKVRVPMPDVPTPPASPIRCQTVLSAISTGTEVGAWMGLPHLRPSVTYPRRMGYLNLARVIDVAGDSLQGSATVSSGDLVVTNSPHVSHFDCAPQDVLAVIDSCNRDRILTYAYAYALMEMALSDDRGTMPDSVLILGGGLLGSIAHEVAVLRGIEVTWVSDNAGQGTEGEPLIPGPTTRGDFAQQRAEAEGLSFTSALLVSSSWNDYQLALEVLGSHGCLTVVGFPGRNGLLPTQNPLDPHLFYAKHLRIRAVPDWGHGRNTGLLGSLQRHVGDVAKRMTASQLGRAVKKLPLVAADELASAYAELAAPDRRAMSILLDWSPLDLEICDK